MITSFFAPKKNSESKKRRRESSSAADAAEPKNDGNEKSASAAVITPSSSSIASSSSKNNKSAANDDSSTAQLAAHLHPSDWNAHLSRALASPKFRSLSKFIASERISKTIYPPPALVFSALNLTPLSTVKVVIVGQDPYHQPNQGHGLSFSVPPGIKIPPSLRNIYKELLNDSNVAEFDSMPQHGNLIRWTKQGVLLLNNVLTVRRGEAASHKKRGWEEFTDAVIEAVVKRDDSDGSEDDTSNNKKNKGSGVVFLLWGKPASLKAQTVLSKQPRNNKKGKHAVIMCSHPSPLGATKTNAPFMGSRCFSRANEELRKRGWTEIDWRVDGPLNEEEDEDVQKKERIEEKTEKEVDDTEDGDDDEVVDC
ncbi:uracil-DNA glycosylase [Skeletonema marinoi]|uniref:Uracil-DNA glycosylase n=1 Tax=Skeletonema marinoi TaxID=267567 RepID=A0AAD8XUJ8_9STRA|nr:uracil-DNA glycosylase [Skeletonema marinoi]